jgi:hypothetical protein
MGKLAGIHARLAAPLSCAGGDAVPHRGRDARIDVAFPALRHPLNVKIDTLRGFAHAFGCPVVDLLPEEDKRKRSRRIA